MSKQSNQRYRKDKENEHLKKADIDSADTNRGTGIKGKDKESRQVPPDDIKR